MVDRVVLVSPRGFCAGVVRAIATVERALATFPPPIHVRRAIVHNAQVVARLARAGAVFVDELNQVPTGGVVVISAHGVATAVRDEARARGLRIVDATCPLVARVHREVRRSRDRGCDVVLIGHRGHDEVVGTLGQAPGVQLVENAADVPHLRVRDPATVVCVSQTTLSAEDTAPVVEALRRRFPCLQGPADICYATRNRQAAVRWLAGEVDVVLVVGDPTSSNSRHLRETAEATGTPAHLVASVAELEPAWLVDAAVVGVSAGASTPEDLVVDVVEQLCRDGATLSEEVVLTEHVSFALPAGLREAARVTPGHSDGGSQRRSRGRPRGGRRSPRNRRPS